MQVASLYGERIFIPQTLNVNQSRPALTEEQVLKGGDGQEFIFTIHNYDYLFCQMTATPKRCKLASTCYWKRYPEPAGLSRASFRSGKAFTLDGPRARGIISTQVEAVKNSGRHLTVLPACYSTHPSSIESGGSSQRISAFPPSPETMKPARTPFGNRLLWNIIR
ncbi:MAG: hypothetical protein DDT24_00318 [Chloroflexi bacterium]|nr:hypothetical protein [Chloroflexota bacterium]